LKNAVKENYPRERRVRPICLTTKDNRRDFDAMRAHLLPGVEAVLARGAGHEDGGRW
jgi:hypothetical protein